MCDICGGLHGQIYNTVNRCDVVVCDLYICREINVTDYLQSMISSNLDMNVDLSWCSKVTVMQSYLK